MRKATGASELIWSLGRVFRRWPRTARAALLTLAVGMFVYAGFWAAYAVFYVELPLEDIADVAGDANAEPFRYDGVVYFDGYRLGRDARLSMRYTGARALAVQRGAELQVFIRVEGMPDVPRVVNGPPREHDPEIVSKPLGVLRVRVDGPVSGKGETVALSLEHRTFQRFRVPFRADLARNNRVIFRFIPDNAASRTDGQPVTILMATNIHTRGLFTRAIAWGGLGLVLIALAAWLFPPVDWRFVSVLVVTAAACWFFQSGGFTSIEYFNGDQNRITGMSKQLNRLLDTGSFRPQTYRNGGTLVAPTVWLALEGSTAVLAGNDPLRLPGLHYVQFTWCLISLGVLQFALYRRYGPTVPLLTGLLYSTHYHLYVSGLYAIDADGPILPWSMLVLASVLQVDRVKTDLGWWFHAAWIGICMVGLGALKMTPAVLIPATFAALWAGRFAKDALLLQWRPAALGVLMTVCLWTGAKLGSLPHSPDRNVGIDGEEFQSSVLWHMAWAANGIFDPYSAHWFTKSGRLRNERLAEQLDLPNVTYLRQAQIATDEVYKPAVIRAMKERPGFFYSNFFHRMLRQSLHLFRLTSADYHQKWLRSREKDPREINGETVPRRSRAIQLTRYGKFWKIAPMYWVAEVTKNSISFGWDLALIGIALMGVCLLRQPAVVVLFLGVIAAKYVAGTTIHGIHRYFAFADIPLLIGLASSFIAVSRALWAASVGTKTEKSHRS